MTIFLNVLLSIIGCAAYIKASSSLYEEVLEYSYLMESPVNDTILMLIGRFLAIPVYIFMIPFGVICLNFIPIGYIFKILDEKGILQIIENFFNKKPLEFLKNYSIKIEKRS